jgi:hypothetical protein
MDLDLWSLPLNPVTHEATGAPAPLFRSSFNERHPRFSHDGKQIAFASKRNGSEEIFVADATGAGSPRPLSNRGAAITTFPRWSPDDERIVFMSTSPNEPNVIFEVDVDAGPPARRLFNGIPMFWSSDYLYYADRHDGGFSGVGMTRRSMPDGGPEQLLFMGALGEKTLDGSRLLYAKPGERGIFSRALAGTLANNPEERLVEDYEIARAGIVPVTDGFYYLGLTPAAAPLAFKFFHYETRMTKEVWPAPPDTDLGMTISPDGRALVFSAPADDVAGTDLTVLEFGRGASDGR